MGLFDKLRNDLGDKLMEMPGYDIEVSKTAPVSGDVFKAFREGTDDDKRKAAMGAAATLTSGAAIVGSYKAMSPELHAYAKTIPSSTQLALQAPALASLGSLSYALHNWDDKKKRNLGIAGSALGYGVSEYAARKLTNPPKFTNRDAALNAIAALGALAFIPAANYTAGISHRIDQRNKLQGIMNTDSPAKEVAQEVNKVRSTTSIVDRIPLLRYAQLPSHILDYFMSHKPVENPTKLSPEDKALYIGIQRDRVTKRMFKEFTEIKGREPNDAEKHKLNEQVTRFIATRSRGV